MYNTNTETDRKQWESRGFYIHLNRNRNVLSRVDYHTHGVLHSRGKYDFQITHPIEPIIAKAIFLELVDRLDQGIEIVDGTELTDVLEGINLKSLISETDSDVLKIIIGE